MTYLQEFFPAYAQCREPIDGIWSYDPSWQCQKPGDLPTTSLGSGSSSKLTVGDSANLVGLSALGNIGDTGDRDIPSSSSKSSSSTTAVPQEPAATRSAMTSASKGKMQTSSDLSLDMYANATASVGGCSGVGTPDGWDGIASTSVLPSSQSL